MFSFAGVMNVANTVGEVSDNVSIQAPVPKDTVVTAVLEHVEGDKYKITGIVDGQTTEIFSTSSMAGGLGGYLTFMDFSYIHKMDIE